MSSIERLPPVDPHQAEQAALERLLRSGYFDRAPSLAAILTYICKEYFAGRSSHVKEYTIATEALGREPSFDQKKDSIVRVEVHRLRKRLRQFYERAGPEHDIEINILDGVYQPLFQPRRPAAAEVTEQPVLNGTSGEPPPQAGLSVVTPVEPDPVPAPVTALEPPYVLPPPARLTWRAAGWGVAGLIVICGMITAAAHWRTPAPLKPQPKPESRALVAEPVAVSSGPGIRILAGRAPGRYVDLYGKTWDGDRFGEGGEQVPTRPDTLIAGYDPNLFAARREGTFYYRIPLPSGKHELRLFFAETEFGKDTPRGGGKSSRIFTVSVNGKPVLQNFDIIADVGGPNIADVRVISGISPGADNYLRLDFTGPAILNAVEIRPSPGPKPLPVRLVCQAHPHRAPDGTLWEPDQFVQGGEMIQRAMPVTWRDDPQLCQGERYGTFTYSIPVVPGSYTLNLYFAETWFGNFTNRTPNDPAEPDSRIFDVICNGKILLHHFDIAREAKKTYLAIRKTFHGLQPDDHGKLVLNFSPIIQNACVNAIEVLPE